MGITCAPIGTHQKWSASGFPHPLPSPPICPHMVCWQGLVFTPPARKSRLELGCITVSDYNWSSESTFNTASSLPTEAVPSNHPPPYHLIAFWCCCFPWWLVPQPYRYAAYLYPAGPPGSPDLQMSAAWGLLAWLLHPALVNLFSSPLVPWIWWFLPLSEPASWGARDLAAGAPRSWWSKQRYFCFRGCQAVRLQPKKGFLTLYLLKWIQFSISSV